MKKTLPFLTLLLFSMAVFAKETPETQANKLDSSLEECFYPSSEYEGYVGVFKELPLDSPTDNVFSIDLDFSPKATQEVVLTYDLYGIADHTGISKSINDQLALGGQLVNTNKQWNSQTEQLHPAWLKKGQNILRFTLPENANHHYRVKNIGLKINQKEVSSTERSIVFNQPKTQTYSQNQGYINGFITGEGSKEAQLFIDDVSIANNAAAFEALIPKNSKKDQENWTSEVKVVFADGQTLNKQINFKKEVPADFQFNTANHKAVTTAETYQPNKAFTLDLQGKASINIATASLKSPTDISITALRSIDMPVLEGTLVNVTKQHAGYRFLPHGTKFSKEATIQLGYDPNKIPDGYTEQDIKTYYFDEQTKHWIPLKKEEISVSNQQIVSKTKHFTDMINGIIKVPESPETAGFTPTSIKDIKAANPAAAINTIAPPSANNMGTANMGYPIELPAGRQGMQPQLGIQYNSGGGNDWLGMGWNLQTPAISIDTRWGVPRYDQNLETETYSMGGSMLTPVAHRGELQSRSSEKQFYPRVEGSFNKIIRHGNNPTNYWWEVTDKSGTTYSYGGTKSGGVLQSAVLKDDQGNIAHWALVETRDLNQNFVRYHYTQVSDVGVQGGSVPGINLYVDRITYTGHGSAEGAYEVSFVRDRDLNENVRPDVSINARYGFKQVTADLLREIHVKLSGENIRHYELSYKQGAFYKTLLDKITQFDAQGNPFNQHEFEYFDDVQSENGYVPYANQENWNPQDDEVHGNFINPINAIGNVVDAVDVFNDDASALSGTKSKSAGGAIAVTVGLPGDLTSKKYSVGPKVGFSSSKSEGMLALVDINGDGLADKVFKKSSSLKYRINESGPNGNNVFGELRPISGISNFSKAKTTSTTLGVEAHPSIAFVGYDVNTSKTKEEVYFTDVNNDKLIDIVSKGKVYFNRLDENGNPSFTQDSSLTPSYVVTGNNIDEGGFLQDPQELEKMIDDFPLHDVVRMWQAPRDGTIAITGDVSLIAPNEASGTADGVKVAIQQSGTELWNETIAATDFSPKSPTGVSSLGIQKGERIYFRVQSIFDGTDDQVNWNPTITYSDHTEDLKDANELFTHQFSASDDFKLSADQTLSVPIDGMITIQATFEKPITSDGIKASIVNTTTGNVIWEASYTDQETANVQIDESLPVLKEDNFTFEVTSDSNVDWSKVTFNPYVFYVSSSDPDYPTVTAQNGDPLLKFYPVVNFSIYNQTYVESYVYEATKDETITLQPKLTVNNGKSGILSFSVKKANELLHKEKITVLSGVTDSIASIEIPVITGDKLFLAYHTQSYEFKGNNTQAQVVITDQEALEAQQENPTEDIPSTNVGLYAMNLDVTFGTLYRGWGQFGYNGNRDRANQPINESELVIDEEMLNPQVPNDNTQPEDLEGGYDPTKSDFILFMANAETQSWNGYDNLTYLTAQSISSSRMGEDDLSINNTFASASGTGASGIVKVTKTRTRSIAGGAGVGIVSGSASSSSGYTENVSDFMDMNGDGYPDIVTESHIQYTNARGGLMDNSVAHGLARHRSEHEAKGINLGGGFVTSKASNTSAPNEGGYSPSTSKNIKQTQSENVDGAQNAQKTAQASVSFSGNFSEGEDEIKHSWMDVNGDGLPDKVYKGGEVALNLGYKFAPKEPWGYAQVKEGKTIDFGAGLGVNYSNGSIVAGISLSRSENQTNTSLQDINGDGLVDILTREVVATSGNLTSTPQYTSALKVNLNTGNGFAPAINWNGVNSITDGASTGEAANAAFTICFPLIPLITVAKLCINPSASVSQGVSRQWSQISDLDGDGYPDILSSKKDNELKVKRSTIGRTNLLKTVHRPLGASFEVDYTRIGNTYAQPTDVWALSEVTLFDGFEGDGADFMKSTFDYQEGYYDRHERDFYGFAKVVSHQLDTENQNNTYRSIIQEFNNDNYYQKGLLEREIMQDAQENPYTESIHRYKLLDVLTGSSLPSNFAQDNDRAAAFVASVETLKKFYEGESEAQKSTRSIYAYDRYGNVKSHTDFGEQGFEDDIFASISYHTVQNKHLVGIPKVITVAGGGKTLRKRETSIDQNTGNLTEIRKYLQDGTASKYNMTYDAYGNLAKIIRPENAQGERLFFEYEYDSQVHTYTTQVKDAYGYSSASTYDLRFGHLLTSTDLNGHQMRYEIDDLGRITTITGPLELAAGKPYTIAFEYYPQAETPWALTKHYDPAHPNNDLETATFIDGLQRSLQVKKDVAIHQAPNSNDREQMTVSGRITFDAFGRAIESYYPTLEGKGSIAEFNANFDNISPTKTTYDVLDRALTVTLPDNAMTQTAYGFGNDRDGNVQFSTQVTDANGISKESFTNIRGMTKAVKEQYSQGEDIWTSYQYNGINELIAVKDDQDNLIESQYDWLGRRTQVLHPDAGITKLEYDLANNLTKKITANLAASKKAITYDYDHERLTQINYPENPQNNVTYTYGEAGASDNRAGRIVLQEDATGAQEFFYNELGAITKNIRTIVIPNSEALSYTTQWQYDTWNRITQMIYPDQETLTYTYNLGGLLHSFKGEKQGTDYPYVKQLGYDKFEQRTYLQYGNGTETSYSYEPERRRLQNMVATTAKNRKMMDNNYTYDKVNNIMRLQNQAEVPRSNEMGGQTDYQYQYDDLYRLTKATGSHLSSNHENSYTLDMAYNSLHSITKKDQLHQFKGIDSEDWSPRNKTTYNYEYEYSETQPHAPVTIGDKAYTYDANGNQTGWTSNTSGQQRELLWDEENRIKAIADNGQLFSYVYDASGERVLKSNGGGQSVRLNGAVATNNTGGIGNYTVYVNPYVVVRNSQVTKHFYIESQRVVTKLAEASDGLLQGKAGGNGANKVDYNTKQQKLKGSLTKNYNDLGLELTPVDDITSNGNAYAYGHEKNGNNGNAYGHENGNNGNAYGHENGNNSNGGNGGTNNGGGNGNGGNGGGNDNGNNGGGNNNNGGGGNGGGGSGGNGNNIEGLVYFYHPDHLGSSSYITDANGEVSQHLEYFAFGETFVEEHSNKDATPYLYNAKELDEETGLYYYGARYYDPVSSVWVSVDPMWEEVGPNRSPYEYTYSNPINLVDPDGRRPIPTCVGCGYAIKRGSELVARKLNGESWSSAYYNTYKNDVKNVARYATPAEDVYGAFTGNDFDGNEYNRLEATAWGVLSFVPGAKLVKLGKTFKYSDKVSDLVKNTGKIDNSAREVITITKSGAFSDAKKIAADIIGDMGGDAVEHIGRKGPLQGKIVGYKSADGSKGWRVDYDDTKGAHINWWNKNEKGAVPFEGGLDQAKRVVDNEVHK